MTTSDREANHHARAAVTLPLQTELRSKQEGQQPALIRVELRKVETERDIREVHALMNEIIEEVSFHCIDDECLLMLTE